MKVNFSVLGFGHIGKRHAAMIFENPSSNLISIIDNDFSKEEEVNQSGFGAEYYPSLEAFLKSDKGRTEVLCVCTPNGFHASHAVMALENGYHAVIEKPMALSKAECEQIIFESLKVNKHVFVVKQNRYSPPSLWLKSVVDNHILGKIYMVQINCYWNRDERYYKKDG